ncbi:MAG TPA: hypothetical protein PKX17_03075, partial [Candidatus Methanomethylicus sp.]|nr:hypothetical protein [Candidatus Methanomethylicus sp.]
MRGNVGLAAVFVVSIIIIVASAAPSVAAAALTVALDSDTSVYSSGEDAHAQLSGNPFASVVVEVLDSDGGIVSNSTVQLNGTGGLILSLNSSALTPGSYTVNATMGAYGVIKGFAIVQPFIGLEVRAAGANGTELSRVTTVYYYYNGSGFNLLANVTAPNSHFSLFSNMSRVGLGTFALEGSDAVANGELQGGGGWYLFLLNGTVPGDVVALWQEDVIVSASGPSGAAAAAHFTAAMNIQPLTADPSIGGSTTDWRDIPDLTNASGLVIERMLGGSPVVRVAFKQPLDLCGASTPAAVASIGALLKTGRGSVYLDVDAIPALNASAEVRMFGLTDYGRPGILVNGVPTVMVGQTSGGPVSGLAWLPVSGELAFEVSSWAEFVADGIAPYAVSVSMAEGQFTPNPAPTITFRVNDTISGVDASTAVFAFDGNSTGLQVNLTGGRASGWYITSTANPLPDGMHIASVRVYDSIGNAALLTVSFYVDTTPPQISGQFPTAGLLTRETRLQAVASFSDLLSGISGAWIFVDGVNRTAQASMTQSRIEYAPASAFAEGWHTIRVTAFDRVGNNNTLEWSYAVDLTPPYITNSHPLNNMVVPLNDSVYVDYADNFGINASLTRVYVDGADVTAASVISGGHIIYSPSPMFAKGVHQVGVFMCDIAGNGAVSNWSFTVDNAPPSIIINSPTNGTRYETKAVSVSIIYYDNLNVDKSSVLIKVDGDNVTPSATISETSLAYQATL